MKKKIAKLMLCGQYMLAFELAMSQSYNIKDLYVNAFKQKFNADNVLKDIRNRIKSCSKSLWQSHQSPIKRIIINNAKVWINLYGLLNDDDTRTLTIKLFFAHQIKEDEYSTESYTPIVDRHIIFPLTNNINFVKLKKDILVELAEGIRNLVETNPALGYETKLIE